VKYLHIYKDLLPEHNSGATTDIEITQVAFGYWDMEGGIGIEK
jgi:hypothetical protein